MTRSLQDSVPWLGARPLYPPTPGSSPPETWGRRRRDEETLRHYAIRITSRMTAFIAVADLIVLPVDARHARATYGRTRGVRLGRHRPARIHRGGYVRLPVSLGGDGPAAQGRIVWPRQVPAGGTGRRTVQPGRGRPDAGLRPDRHRPSPPRPGLSSFRLARASCPWP